MNGAGRWDRRDCGPVWAPIGALGWRQGWRQGLGSFAPGKLALVDTPIVAEIAGHAHPCTAFDQSLGAEHGAEVYTGPAKKITRERIRIKGRFKKGGYCG